MTARLLIHIGLPKTATTTLQAQYFPSLGERGCLYLGTFQPRDQPQNRMFLRLREAITRPDGDLAEVSDELQGLLVTENRLIVSEEMFLVSGRDSVSWRDKLRRLASLVAGLDYAILVTVREPCSGSFSYYVELEPRYRSLGLDYVSSVMADDAMQIYDYTTLLKAIDECFPKDRVHFLDFDDIVAGRFAAIDSLLGLTAPAYAARPVPMNTKRVNAAGEVMTGRKLTVGDALRRTIVGRWLRHRLGGGGAFFIMLRSMLRRFDAVVLAERSVSPPNAQERAEVAAHLLPGWQLLRQRMATHG